MDIAKQGKRREWQEQSLCANLPNSRTYEQIDNIFFNAKRGRPYSRTPSFIGLCRSCPVMLQCLNFAIVHDAFGVWGGTTQSQRQALPPEFVEDLTEIAKRDGWYEGKLRFDQFVPRPRRELPSAESDNCTLDDLENPLDVMYTQSEEEAQSLAVFGFA